MDALFRLGVVTFVALLLPTASVGSHSVSDHRLAQRLVISSADVPSHWIELDNPGHPLVQCIEGMRHLTGRVRERAVLGTPNSAVWSFATVFANENEATDFYASVLRLGADLCSTDAPIALAASARLHR